MDYSDILKFKYLTRIACSGWDESYVGELKKLKSTEIIKHEKPWPVYQVINALLDTGLTLLKFEEHPH